MSGHFQVTKEDASEGSTVYAQGGISAVLAQFDTVDDHIYDSMVAGDFLNDREWVAYYISHQSYCYVLSPLLLK